MSALVKTMPDGKVAEAKPRRGFTVVRLLLGCLLLTAAGLKLYGLNVTALPRSGWFATPRVQIAAVVVEIIVGAWLISGRAKGGAWLAAVGTFLAFGAVSSYLGYLGVASCGCLGVIKASPWSAFTIDAVALGLLAWARPRRNDFQSTIGPATGRRAAMACAVVVLGLGLTVAAARIGFGSVEAAVARLRGEPLTVSTDFVDCGEGHTGERPTSTVEIANWSGQSVRLTGGTSDCSCLTTEDLPVTIPPGESRSLTIALKAPATAVGQLTRNVELWTDLDGQRIVRLRVGCRVVR